MNKLPKLLTKMSWVLRQATAELLISLEDYQASLARIYHSELFCQEVAVLNIDGHAWRLHILVSELAERTDLLNHMHPLEAALVRLLAEEESPGLCFLPEDSAYFEDAHLLANRFACIDTYFKSDTRHTTMVVVTDPTSDKQVCLSVKELINQQQGLLKSIKHLSSVSTHQQASYFPSKQQAAVC